MFRAPRHPGAASFSARKACVRAKRSNDHRLRKHQQQHIVIDAEASRAGCRSTPPRGRGEHERPHQPDVRLDPRFARGAPGFPYSERIRALGATPTSATIGAELRVAMVLSVLRDLNSRTWSRPASQATGNSGARLSSSSTSPSKRPSPGGRRQISTHRRPIDGPSSCQTALVPRRIDLHELLLLRSTAASAGALQ